MTTPNIEELLKRAKRLRNDLDESNARLDQKCVTAMYEMEQALQSQAERIKDLNAGMTQVRLERDTLRAQLAALQVDDELPEPDFWLYPHGEGFRIHIGEKAPEGMKFCEPYFTADQLRQAKATVRAKMVPLEKDAARYRWLRDYLISDRTECDDAIVDALTTEELDATVDASEARHITIDAAMGITGEPK